MDKITALIAQLHAALASEPAHLGVLYQVQGNLVDGQVSACSTRASIGRWLSAISASFVEIIPASRSGSS